MIEGVGGGLIAYSDLILVQCPECRSCARITTPNNAKGLINPRYMGHESKRLQCIKCGLTKEVHPKRRWDNLWAYTHELFDEKQGLDWYFGLPLYLQIQCCGHKMWFFNFDHLSLVEKYIKKNIRPSGLYYLSIESRLPKWMKLSKNREEVLKAITKLKQQ
ncbi:hypothetical protein [Gottfriedia solisilvae]|uniref:Uncharacterized protein n=1 Tax=Gottfriedia solisilvae TaxID=1516104 RepID=A0A8J3AFK9_9BACI|nr:hypothetical protein [Gottfriedia solisilvae]GGI11647.1 hypothetical protein GCM10007380_08890 [Gottfriedia solisilvae]